MRILFVSQYFWPESFRGNEIAFELASRGHEVTVLTAKPNYPGGRFFKGYGFFRPREELVQGVRIIRTPIFPRGKGRGLSLLINYVSFVLFSYWATLFRLGRNYDVIFVQQLSPVFAALPGVWMKQRLGIPLVLWVLDLWPESITAASKVKSPVVIRWVTRIVRKIYRSADVVLMSSRCFAGSIRSNLGGLNIQPEYFPNWAEEVFLHPPTSMAPLPVTLPKGFNLMFAGNLGEAQDFETILNAAELTLGQGVNWLLVGAGRKVQWIEEQIRQRSLANVFLLGHHPIETMPRFFAGADAMLLSLGDNPLFRLTVPAKLQAYMASSKVIIGVLAGEGAEVLCASGGGIVVEPGSVKDLVKAVMTVRDLSETERQAMAQKARRYYDENFNREHRMGRLEDIFFQLVNQQPARMQ